MESDKCSPQVRVDVALRGRRRRNTTSNELKSTYLCQHRKSDPPLVRRAHRRDEKWTHRRVSLLLAARHFDGFTNFAAVKVEGDASPKAMSQVDLPRTPRKRKADVQTQVKAAVAEEAPVKIISQTDLPQTARRRKSDPSTSVKVEEDDSLAKAASQSNSPKTPRKRGPARVNKDTVGTATPASPQTKSPAKRRTAANDVAKGSETVVDDQTTVINAETEPCSGATATPRKDHAKDLVSSKSPAKRKRRASVDGSPSKKRRSGPVKSEQVESLSLGPASLPLLEFPSGNTPSLWASNKTDLVILTSKLNMVTTIFVDQESAIGIAIQVDGEVELSITRDCSRQSALIDSLIPLDVPEAPQPPPEDMPVSSPINLVDPHPSTPVLESEIPTTHASNPISSSSDDFPGGVNTVAHPSSTQVTEIPTSDSSLPGLSIHEPLKTYNLQASGRVSQHTSFGDLVRRDTNILSTPSFPPDVRTSPPPPGLHKPDVAIRPSPSVVSRDQTIIDVQQAPFLFGSNHVSLPSFRSSTPPPRTMQRDRKRDDYPRETLSQRLGPPLHHSRYWDNEWDNYPQKRFSQRSGSPIHHHKHWDNKWTNYPRETGSRRPTYPSPEGHSSLSTVAKDPRHDPFSGRPVGPGKTSDPRRRSPARGSLQAFSPAPVSHHQSQVPEHKPGVSTSRSSKSGLPSFKKIRSAAGSSILPPLSTSVTSNPLPPGLHIHEPRSIEASWPTHADAQVHGRSHLGLSAGGDHNRSSSSFPATSARRHFYDQRDHPYRKMESSSNMYSERLELYSSKKTSLTSYMMDKLSQGMGFQHSDPFKSHPSSGRPPNPLPLPRFSTVGPAPIIKKEADLIYPFRPQPAGGPTPFVSKRSSSPPLYVPSATPPPDNLLKISRPSSPDSLYAPSPTIHDIQPLNVPCEDTYMLDEVPFSPPLPPPTIVLSTARVDPLPPSMMKPRPLAMFFQGGHNANTAPQSPSLSSVMEEERNLPNTSQSDIPCEEGAGCVSNTREAGQNGILRQLQAEQIVNTDLTRHESNGLHSGPQEIGHASESNPGIHEPLQAISPDIQQLTSSNVALPEQADLPDNVAPMAETEEIVIDDLPEVQQFANTDFPALLFVPLPGYGYASLGYFRNLGIVSKTSTDEGKRTVWRARLRWVADEEYGEIEDETVAKGCWWSEQKVVEDIEDKFVRDQCPGLGIGMRAVERWWCRGCGRVNREDGWKWRRCLSEKCKDREPEFLKALSLDEVRGRNDRMPMARPHEMASVPGITTTTWEDGTVTYMYPLSASRLVKHIFTGNYPPLQEDASKLWVGLQGKGVELIRGRDGPYYTCAFVGNREDWPESVKEASEVISDSAVGYGEFPSGMDIQRVEVLAWFIKGSAKFKAHETGAVSQVLRAKQCLVGILSLGCEVEIFLHKCRAVAELPSMEGLLTFKAEDGTEQVTVDAEPSIAKPSALRKKKVADAGDLSIHMVHGDVLILSGDDFEYNIKRSGSGMLIIASSDV
ncbi:hypothetical protein EV421DRAFT_1782734 [Armillaria borealis]|uniref:Uncharacterized protein n=1 Tax=Armillaria borealis TaxID=47425 RepID=A0AA39MVF1_9AGAR|nr:hypothetical protein EV421DRAFT_1782734 [Armillaria borealis]